MLRVETIEPRTFSILKQLMEIPQLNDFHLVGGTALALKYGHRKSVDLDLFTNQSADYQEISMLLQERFQERFQFQHPTKIGLFGFIEEVKVDFVTYPHAIIRPAIKMDEIRMYDDADLAAMKIQAILGRGVKKDFWDIAKLLEIYTLEEMISFHKEKYPSQMLAISIPKALSYFADADKSADPISCNNWDWLQVKHIILEKIDLFLS